MPLSNLLPTCYGQAAQCLLLRYRGAARSFLPRLRQVVTLLALAAGYNIFDILKIIVQKNNSVELSGKIDERIVLQMNPTVENKHSTGTLDADIPRYDLAT